VTEAPATTPSKALNGFYLLAFGISWGVGGLALLASAVYPGFTFTSSNPLYFVAAFGPSIAALIMTARLDGWTGVKTLLSRLVPRRAGLPWYLGVIVGFPVVATAAAASLPPHVIPDFSRPGQLLYLLPFTLVIDAGPLGEELGWRGFALPRILRKRDPAAAAIVLGVIWVAWHIPTFFIPTLSQSRLSFPLFASSGVALSVIMTWLYVRTKGDVALMVLVHLMSNYTAGALGFSFRTVAAAQIACAVAVFAGGGLQATPPSSRRSM
jgi:membrane protease YdiL (CAAX protease family)